MTGYPVRITQVMRLPRFDSDYARLDVELQAEVEEAVRDLMEFPIPTSRRFHDLKGYRNPRLFTIDVTSNKSHKISLELNGSVATLRRVATHKRIDSQP